MVYSNIIQYVNEKIEKKNERHHYAYFIKGKQIIEISKGENSFIKNETCTTIHAELDALQKIIKWRICPNKLDLLVIKLNKNGEIGEAKPCPHCIFILNNTKIKIKNIYYSSKVNNKYCIVKEKFNKMVEPIDDKRILSKAYRYKCGEKIYYKN